MELLQDVSSLEWNKCRQIGQNNKHELPLITSNCIIFIGTHLRGLICAGWLASHGLRFVRRWLDPPAWTAWILFLACMAPSGGGVGWTMKLRKGIRFQEKMLAKQKRNCKHKAGIMDEIKSGEPLNKRSSILGKPGPCGQGKASNRMTNYEHYFVNAAAVGFVFYAVILTDGNDQKRNQEWDCLTRLPRNSSGGVKKWVGLGALAPV